jgi:hypothetical protein
VVYSGNVFETRCGMAIFTYVSGIDVRYAFSRCVNAVMAARTISAHGTVVKLGVIPAISVVAVIAGFRALNMVS